MSKFHFIDPKSIVTLLPAWIGADPIQIARALDSIIGNFPEVHRALRNKNGRWRKTHPPFWIEINALKDPISFDVRESVGDDDSKRCAGRILIDCISRSTGGQSRIELPLLEIYRESQIPGRPYCLYLHAIGSGEQARGYFGMTRQPWFKRLDQHLSDSRRGSNLLFHRSLREQSGEIFLHRIYGANLHLDNALELEEEFVGLATLYPLGLNMIPGGRAGFAYLGKMGFAANTVEGRETALEALLGTERINGQPNPLCAARWASDQEFINSVICGPVGRLTVRQVRDIRIAASFGKPTQLIATEINDNVVRVQRVLSGRRYGRVQ